jgi:phage-related minor tail protein
MISNHFYLLCIRLKMLTKQVEDAQELRKQLSETVSDLQRQLKNEREENKKSKKRSVAAFRKNVINNY